MPYLVVLPQIMSDDSSHRDMTRRLSGALDLAGSNQDGGSSDDEDLMEEGAGPPVDAAGANRATGNTEDGASSDDDGGLMGEEGAEPADRPSNGAPLVAAAANNHARLHLYL